MNISNAVSITDTKKMVHRLVTCNFDEFVESISNADVEMLYNVFNSKDMGSGWCLEWDKSPYYTYCFLFNKMLIGKKSHPASKKMRMLHKLGDNVSTPDTAFYRASSGVNLMNKDINERSLYKDIEYMVFSTSIDKLMNHIRYGGTENNIIAGLWMVLISQLNEDEYTIEDGVYKLESLGRSVDRLYGSINFDMCLLDIYSILFFKEFLSFRFSLANGTAVRKVIYNPIEEIESHDREKKSYYTLGE